MRPSRSTMRWSRACPAVCSQRTWMPCSDGWGKEHCLSPQKGVIDRSAIKVHCVSHISALCTQNRIIHWRYNLFQWIWVKGDKTSIDIYEIVNCIISIQKLHTLQSVIKFWFTGLKDQIAALWMSTFPQMVQKSEERLVRVLMQKNIPCWIDFSKSILYVI